MVKHFNRFYYLNRNSNVNDPIRLVKELKNVISS